MANREQKKIAINKDRFMTVVKSRGYTIKKLGESDLIDRGERTLGRYLHNQEMPVDILNQIASYLGVSTYYLAGYSDTDLEYCMSDRMAAEVLGQLKVVNLGRRNAKISTYKTIEEALRRAIDALLERNA